MDLASLPVSRIRDLVNNNVDTMFFTGEAGKDRRTFIVVDGQTAEITPWVIDRVKLTDNKKAPTKKRRHKVDPDTGLTKRQQRAEWNRLFGKKKS